MPHDPQEELTLAAAARELGMTRQNLSHAVKQGQIPARRVSGTVVLVKRADVLAYAAQPKHRGGRGKKSPPRPDAAAPSGEQPG
jgi:excisionase family DNA binding protein